MRGKLTESHIVKEHTQLFTIHNAGPDSKQGKNINAINYNAISDFCSIWGESLHYF